MSRDLKLNEKDTYYMKSKFHILRYTYIAAALLLTVGCNAWAAQKSKATSKSQESAIESLLTPSAPTPATPEVTTPITVCNEGVKIGFDRERLKYTDAAINRAIRNYQIPGAVLAIVRGDSIEYLKAYGNRQLEPSIERMTTNTIFDIASCTKPIVTALSAMILVDQGRLSLHDDLDLYFHDFNDEAYDNKHSSKIRVKHLMTHTSGLVSYVDTKKLEETYETVNRDSLVDYIMTEKRRSAPNTKFKYSCINYILLQYIIEDITGETLQEFAKKNIFDLLGMKESDFIAIDPETLKPHEETKLDIKRIAPTEYSKEDSCFLHGVAHDPLARKINNGVSGNAGLFTTASDLAILASALLNDGEYKGKRVLSPLAVKAMRGAPRDAEELGRSLGWDIFSPYASSKGDLLSDDALTHTGYTGSAITIDTENDIAIILLTNYIHQKHHSAKDIVRLRSLVANSIASAIRFEE